MAGRRAATVSLTDIAEVFGVTTEAIRLWRKEGMPTRMQSGQPRFVVTECVKWRRERDRTAAASEAESDTTREDRRAIIRADRQLREMEVRERMGALVERATFDDEIERFVGGFVAAVSSRLQQFERDIVQATTPAAARALTERIQDDVLQGARTYADALEASAEAEEDAPSTDQAA